jgi:hypothetical protein
MNTEPERTRPIRSAGAAYPLDVIRNRFRGPSQSAIAADIAAVDNGTARTVACMFRADYGDYPRRFTQRMLDLLPNGPVVRPFWYSLRRARFRIDEPVVTAFVRSRNPRTDWNVRATGMYSAGARLEWAGFEVISCRTSLGVLEFAVPRPDVPLLVHYLNNVCRRP